MVTTQPELVIATIMRKHGTTGLQTYMNTLADYTNQAGGSAQVVTPFDYKFKLFVKVVFGVRRLTEKFSNELSTWWYEYWHYYFLKLALRDLLRTNARLNRPTIVYAQCPLSAKAALETKMPGQKVFMVVHFNVSQADEWADKGKIRRNGRLFQSINNRETVILPAVDGVIFVSDFMKKLIIRRIPSLAEKKTACIPCFTNPPKPDGAKSTYDLVSIGTLESRKNQSYLLNVLSILKTMGQDVSLTLIGDGIDKQALVNLSVDLGIKQQVRFLGYQKNGADFIPGHRVYVHSAKIENLPISLLEAQACGLPIMAPEVGGIPEIITDGKEGFFWPLDNPEVGAERLHKILSNPVLYSNMSNAASIKFRSTFQTSVVVGQLMDFFRSH